MSDAIDIVPQQPGVIAGVDQSKLQTLADGTVGDIAEALPGLSDAELVQLEGFERLGKNRKTALAAINEEQGSRDDGSTELVAEPSKKTALGDMQYANMRASELDPETLTRPTLTLDGWLLPRPSASPEG